MFMNFQNKFNPPPPPGAPFADYNAQGLTAGALTSWANSGTDAAGTLDVNPGETADPTVVVAGSGPISDATYVSFVSAGRALQGDFSYGRRDGIKFAAVVRWVGGVATRQTFFDGLSATNRITMCRAVTTSGWLAGASLPDSIGSPSLAAERDKWVRIYGILGVNGIRNYIFIERVNRGAGDTGPSILDGLTIGSDAIGQNPGNIDVARLTLWDDDTSIKSIEKWIEEAYYFSPVPPGNPFHWWNPNNFPIGTPTTITDAGSDGFDLTNNNVTVAYDTECRDQKVFVFNGTTARMIDPSLPTPSYPNGILSDEFTVATCIRINTAGKLNPIVGAYGSAYTDWWCHINASNVTVRNAGASITNGDLDTIAPFLTPSRWVNLSFNFATAAGNGSTYVDGVAYASGDEGDQNPNTIAVGFYDDGVTAHYFHGRMSDILVYGGSPNDSDIAWHYARLWLKRWRRLATIPGAPTFVYDAEDLGHSSGDLVSTWPSPVYESPDLTAAGGLRPVFDNVFGPEEDSKNTVYFNGDYMDSSTFTAKTQGGAAAVVFKPAALPTGTAALIGTGTAGTEWSSSIVGSPEFAYSRADSGNSLVSGFGTGFAVGEWAWQAIEYNGTSSKVHDSNGVQTTGSAGTETFGTIFRLGSDSGTNNFNGYIAKAIVWDDGTSIDKISQYMRDRYSGASSHVTYLDPIFYSTSRLPPPGAPFADYDAEREDVGTLAVWNNRGSDSDGDLDTNPGTSNDPTVVLDGTGPTPGSRFVRFALSNTEGLQGPFTTARTGEVVFAAVLRWNGGSTTNDQDIFDGGTDSSHRMSLFRRSTTLSGYWGIYGGTVIVSNTAAETDKWVRVVGRFSSTAALLSVERAKRGISVNAGTQDLNGFTIGTSFLGTTGWANVDVARVTLWEDGTTPLQAERWLEESFPFDPVPPGNPVHWWDPNDYRVGTLSGAGAVVDKGSGGVDLTATALDVVLDDSDRGCPEQKVFKFNNTTSKAEDAGGFSLTGDIHLFGVMVRPVGNNLQDAIMGRRGAVGSLWNIRLTTLNEVSRSFGIQVNGSDLDTLAPFNTRSRWINTQTLTAAAAGAGGTYVDGTLAGASNEGDNDPGSIQIGQTDDTDAFNGYMSDVLIYTGIKEANASRAAEVEMWLQRHRRLATVPYGRFSDIDAESITLASGEPVSTWVVGGETPIGSFTQTGTNRPTFLVGAGPEPAASVKQPSAVKEVYFDDASSQYMVSGTFTTLPQPGAIAIVYKPKVFPVAGSDQLTSSGNAAGTSWDVYIYDAAGTKQVRTSFGATGTLTPSNDALDEWQWIVVEVNNTQSHMVNSKGQDSGDYSGGTESIGTNLSVGASYTPGAYYDGAIARMIHWDEESSWEKISEWMRRRYPGVNPYG